MGRVIGREELATLLKKEKEKGSRIVFTNGCFDLIHAGHIKYLKEAKSLGSILVVGINTDKSVAGLKSGRPIVPEAQRAEVLSALEMVDFVVPFNEDTPYELIKLLKPDILVKGGDWKKEDIIGSDLVADTRSLPYTRGISTTEIIKKIKKLQ